jgi:hypothetical protein
MTDQSSIDRDKQIASICEWMGWHKWVLFAGTPPIWCWLDAQNKRVADHNFNPFTSPNDCARVMKQCDRREIPWHMASPQGGFDKHSANLMGTKYLVFDDSWTEAFCNALLAMISE